MLYLCNMSFFLCFVVWDTRRVEQKKKECFGLFRCKESSPFCCKGKFASGKQREYIGNIQFAVADISAVEKF